MNMFFGKTIGELNLIRCLMLPLMLLSKDILNEVIPFLKSKTMWVKNIGFHILVVE